MANNEQYGLQYINPTIFWVYHVGKFDFDGLEERCQVYDEDQWACKLNTSRKTEYNWKPFVEHIKPYFGHKYLPHAEKDVEVRFAMPWMNVYTKGCYQESHNHLRGRTSLAYCYFHKLPKGEGAGRFGFFNEMYRSYVNTVGEMSLPDCAEWWYPDLNEGDLLIFPSSLTHHVTLHKIDDERITVSGNVGLFSKAIDEVY